MFLIQDEETSSTLEELSKHLIKLQEIHTRTSQLPPEVWEKLKSLKTLLDTMVKSN
jgi:iron-sulfur cluster repair protein YtfE (RIC family)